MARCCHGLTADHVVVHLEATSRRSLRIGDASNLILHQSDLYRNPLLIRPISLPAMNSSAAVAPGLANGHAPYGPNGGAAATTKSPVPFVGPTSPQSSMIASGQNYLVFPEFVLESGITLYNVPVAYKTWGKLDPATKDNVLVVAHALTGSADVEDWWGPLLGPGKLFDPTRFFIFCANVLGSPYGSAGPCTRKGGEQFDEASQAYKQPEQGWNGKGWWGPEFPATTVRDDVRIQKAVLDHLGVEAIFACIGGSMGGMSVLEWPLCFPVRFPVGEPNQLDKSSDSVQPQRPYLSCIIPIATAARHGAWCISWAEAQRQSIYSDPLYSHGYYAPEHTPRAGLAAARMAALLTYRSRDSFESRFGRRTGAAAKGGGASSAVVTNAAGASQAPERRPSDAEQAVLAHNEGNQGPRPLTSASATATASVVKPSTAAPLFSAQSYLRYQGDKFVKRFDANCYVHLTRKMDTHDLARGRAHWALGFKDPSEAALKAREAEAAVKEQQVGELEVLKGEKRLPHAGEEDDEALARVLGLLARGDDHAAPGRASSTTRQGAVAPVVHVVSISSDGLFQTPEQKLIHALIPGSTFQEVPSPEGHDGFLLEFEAIGDGCANVLRRVGPKYYEGQGVGYNEWKDWGAAPAEAGIGVGGERTAQQGGGGGTTAAPVKESVFGEVEDLTRW